MRHSRIQTICLFLFTILLVGGMARTAAAQGSTSYIDEHNRFILNGEPFFPIGLYVAQCSTEAEHSLQLNQIESSPFDTLMNDSINRCGRPATPDEINNYLDQLESRNLKLIFSLVRVEEGDLDGRPLDIDTIEDKVNTFKNRSAIISWYMQEERDPDVCESELEAAYNKIRGLDENHPVWSVIGGWSWNIDWLTRLADTTDIVGVDPYPIPGMPITLVSQMADAAISTGKPLWLVPQMFDWTDVDPQLDARWPTRDEMRAMTYLAVNHGAKGLIYYSYYNILADEDYDTRWQQIKEIASEIDQLRPVFLSTYQTCEDDISCNNDNIDFKLMWNDNKYYLFAVNTQAGGTADVSFQINLTHKPAVFDTLFEDGQISVTDGKVTDDFDVYEVHVYRWEGDFEEASTGDGGNGGGNGGLCFIATAAFGSYVDPHVQVIRDFRDEYLLTNMPGRWFVGMYNTYSPFWADLLNAHPSCKPFVRLALMPLVGMSYFALKTSLATKLLTGFLLMGLVVICVLRIHSRSSENNK